MTTAFQEDAYLSEGFQIDAGVVDYAFQECAFQYDAFQADMCPVNLPEDVYPGAGHPTGIYWGVRKIKKGKRLDDLLKKAMEQVIHGDIEALPETPTAKAVEIVRPYIKTLQQDSVRPVSSIDWRAVENDLKKVRELLKLWEEQMILMEEEDILLLSEW